MWSKLRGTRARGDNTATNAHSQKHVPEMRPAVDLLAQTYFWNPWGIVTGPLGLEKGLCLCSAKGHHLLWLTWVLKKGSCCHGSHESWKDRKDGGNSAPQKRQPFPEVDQEKLDEVLHNYCRSMGIKEASNLYQYKDLQAQQAESPNSIQKLTKLLGALLTVTSTAKVKYKYLRQTPTLLTQTWGSELLAAHWEAETSLPPGRAADAAGVLLKHWRRCAPSDVAWGKLISKFWRCWERGLHGMARRKEKGCWRTTSQKWARIPKVTPAWQPWTLHFVKKKVKMRVRRKAAAVTWKGYLLAWRRIGKRWQWKSLLLPLGMSHLRALWRHLGACEEAFCIQARSWLED